MVKIILGIIIYFILIIMVISVVIVLWFKIAKLVYKGTKGIIKQIGLSRESNAEELKKFKDLLDSRIITQEEFDAKKKQLLGL